MSEMTPEQPTQQEMEQMFLKSGLEKSAFNWSYFVEGVLGDNKPDRYHPPEVHKAYQEGRQAAAIREYGMQATHSALTRLLTTLKDRLFAKFNNSEGWTIHDVMFEVKDEFELFARTPPAPETQPQEQTQ